MDDRMEKVLQSIRSSAKKVNILPVDTTVLEKLLSIYEINLKSLLGTILTNTGGMIVEDWIRIYGAGKLNFYQRNHDFPCAKLLVAEDILGGLFAILESGTVGYFAPDTLQWEDQALPYSQFLYWCFHGDTDTYYKKYRWLTWKDDSLNLSTENGFAFYPFLWAKANANDRYRKEIPMQEILQLEFDFIRQ